MVGLALLFLFSVIPLSSFGQTTRTINMPQFGKPAEGDILVAADEEITFYDPWGTEDIRATNTYNSLSAIVFKPATEGYAVQVTFETVDLNYFSANYPLYLNVYDGVIDSDNSYVFPESSYDVSGESGTEEMPGKLLEKLKGTYSNKTFLSSDNSGALSFLFHHRNSNSCSGWVAKVKTIKLTDMEIVGSGAANDKVNAAPTKKENIRLAGFYINTEGVKNPHILTSVSFKVPVNEAIDPTSFKLFNKDLEDYAGAEPLESTLSNTGDVYTLTLNSAIASGVNNYVITGTVKSDAAFGSKVSVSVESLTTVANPEGLPGFVKADPVEVTIPYMVLMGSTHQTYNVGANEILFYDDGGKDDKISLKYEGSVTFVPTTPGNKIQIDFKVVKLYENTYGSSSNDDLAFVYDGKVKDDNKLNEQLHNAHPIVVKSMSDDGALTVYLKSVTGDYYRGQGFEAVVSEYTPAPMTVKTVNATQYTTGNILAGDINQAILNVEITTENTIAVNAEAFSFNINGTTTPAHLKNAKLFYTGKSKEFDTKNLVAEKALTGDLEFVISDLSVQLVEGSNNFWLAFDVDPKALTGEIIDAGCSDVTVGGQKSVISNVNPEGNRTVKNVYTSVVGNFEKTVFGTWEFISEENPLSYYNGYNPVNGDQITTFLPGTDGMIIEIDFQKFAIYYGTNSYDTRAKFEIYSGKGETKELLWSLNNAADKNVGPGRILRSKAADGSLTVIFNAKTTSPSYTAAGFKASVREYKSVPMTINSITTTQSNTNIIPIAPPATNQEIIGFNIAASGDKNPKVLESITLDLKGCQDKISQVNISTTGADSEVNVTEHIVVAEPSADNSVLTITPSKPIAINEGDNHFWVSFNIKADLANDDVIDCALKSLKISGEDVTPENGDPEGERLMKNIVIMKSGANGEYKVGASSIAFYDEGGIEGGITRGFSGYITFTPSTPGKTIKLTLKKWNIGGSDYMEVYYGGKLGNEPDLKIESTKYPTEVISFADDGKITLKFHTSSYGSSTGLDGWEIEVSEYEIQPLSLGEVTSKVVSSPNSLRGASQNIIRFDVEIKGDKGEFTIDQFNLNLAGTTDITNIEKATVFATDTVSTFLDLNKFAETTEIAEDLALKGKYTANFPGVYKFWVQYQIAPTAETGNTICTESKSVVTNTDQTTALTETSKSLTTISKGFSGTYTIGKSAEADYADFTTAIEAMKYGIDAPVVFEIENGEYDEVITVPVIKGSSENNTITFKSKSGNYNDVVIFNNSYVEPQVPSDKKVESEHGVWTFAGADYVTLEGVTLKTTDTGYPALMKVKLGSIHNTVRNCYITAPMTTSYSADITLIELYSRNVAGDNNDYFTVENSILEGGYRGLSLGSSWVNLPTFERGARIVNNKFIDNGSRAIYLITQCDFNISNNEVVNKKTNLNFNSFDFRNCYGECIINGNSFDFDLSEGVTALYTEFIKADAEHPAVISNNEIKIKGSSDRSYYYGIKIGDRDLSTNVNIVYNTVRIYGEGSSSAALFINNYTEANINNNIFQNEAGGYVYRVYSKNYFPTLKLSNNVLFSSGTEFSYDGSALADFAAWVADSGETGSFSEKVTFLADYILEPATEGSLLNAKPLTLVKQDITGTNRSETKPTIGAYEYNESTAQPKFIETYPQVKGITHNSAIATGKIDMNGKLFAVCKLATEPAPAADEVLQSTKTAVVKANAEGEISFTELVNQTEYKVYFVIQSLRGINSEVIATEVFSTTYEPTKVSTFERVTTTEDGGFDDGTAHFTKFTITTDSEAPGVGNHVAKITDTSCIVLNNSDKGVPLTGFFLKANETVTMTVYDENGSPKEFSLNATDGKWLFMNLKDKGLITKVEMSTTGDAWIDDFSGYPLELIAYIANTKANENDEVTLTINPSTGVAPYTYKWENAMHQTVGDESNSFKFTAKHTTYYKVTVTDAWGSVSSNDVEISVTGTPYTATFEDVYMDKAETAWNGNGPDVTEGSGKFFTMYSGSYTFSVNRHTSTWWSGHACSNFSTTEYIGLEDQYKSAPGGGNNSTNYCVTYVDQSTPHAIYVTNAEVDTINGMYVTNTAWVKDAILNGDGMSDDPDGFKKGDYFKLVVKGQGIDGNFKSLDYYLADYRNENEDEHYLVDTWQWLDLRPLGEVKKLVFSLEGTKSNSWGLTTPCYFCMDDVNGTRNIIKKEEIRVGLEPVDIDLADYFTFDTTVANVKYVITDAFDNSIADMSINSNKLTVTGKKDLKGVSVIISATQKGVTEYIELPVLVDSTSGVDGIEGNGNCRIYPIPAVDHINIATDMTDYTVEILSTNGASLIYSEGNDGNSTVPFELSQGVYLVKITNHSQTVVKQILVK